MIYTIPDYILEEVNMTAEEMRQQLTELLVEKRILTAEQAAEVVPRHRRSPQHSPRTTDLSPTLPVVPALTEQEFANLSEQNRLGIQLMEEWLKTPDDKGDEWWAEFDRMVYEERKKFKFREIEL